MSDNPSPNTADTASSYTPAVPEQVKRQMAEADAIRAQLEANASPEGGAAADAPTEPSGEQPAPQPDGQPPLAATAEDEQTWEQRFRSQQGRLEQAMRTNQQLVDRLNDMDKQIATMKVRGVDPQGDRPPAAVPISKPKLITAEEAAEYGDEFLTVVGKRAKEEFSPELESLADRLKRLEGRVDGVGSVMEKTQQQDLYSGLSSAVPDWRAVNKSDDFKLWLQQPDPFSGRRRHDMLKEAFSRQDGNRVVAFFRGFLTEAAGLPPTPQGNGPSAPPLASPQGQGNGSGKPSLADFAAPGRARSAPQQLPPDKPTYTQAQIAKFSADKLMGRYRGREADAEAIERDIFQAQHEGRIHP